MNVKDVYESVSTIRSINWDNAWRELTKIPSWMKCLLVFAISLAILYLAWQTFFLEPELDTVIQQVDVLNERVQRQVQNSEYQDDIVYIIMSIKVIGESQDYIYSQEQEQLKLIKQFLQREHPGDAIITDIDAMINRNKVEHELLQLQLNRSLDELGGDTVTVQKQ